MESLKSDFDITSYKQVLEEAPSEENGWHLHYDGPLNKKVSPGISNVKSLLFCHSQYNENLQ